MKTAKHLGKQCASRSEQSPRSPVLEHTTSTPSIPAKYRLKSHEFGKPVLEGQSASESQLYLVENDARPLSPSRLEQETATGDQCPGTDVDYTPSKHFENIGKFETLARKHDVPWKQEKIYKCGKHNVPKKMVPRSPPNLESALERQIRDIHYDTRKSARIIRDSRARLLDIQKKPTFTDLDVKELSERNELVLKEMEKFDKLTKMMQRIVSTEAEHLKKLEPVTQLCAGYTPDAFEPVYNDVKLHHPTTLPAAGKTPGLCQTRSKSEIDLTRKLSESYDMQEKLAADNADLEVKRYILYKELMVKDQSLETCKAQIQRLQGELKLMHRENNLLQEKFAKNNPEGDATPIKENSCQRDTHEIDQSGKPVDSTKAEDLGNKLEQYKTSTKEFEKHLGGLEVEVHNIRVEMDRVKEMAGFGTEAPASACRGGGAGGPNTCFQQPPSGPPVPPMTRACGVCPPCPAPCNPNAPPTPAEREVAKLTLQLRQTEESFKTKVTECAMLRADLLKKKEELETERCQHREVQHKLRDLEMRFEGLTTHTNMLLGTKEQAFEQEVNVRTLKQCYREAREEIDELRTLMKEQNDQLQDYRVKYLQAQQLVEEQRRQMDMMDMDNSRISEQINLEIQRVKLKFQEKLQELAPIPDLLKATQMRLKDAQQGQALAEHNAEQLARELNSAREKVHVLLHNSLKPAEKPQEKGNDDKQMAILQQRIAQLTENNVALKSEIERLKNNVIRMEEAVLANEKRLQEKMHECAQLGGELDRARDEAARALARAGERTDTIRKCMQTTVAELERQLAASRAQVKTGEKEREELQTRMQCQIRRLNENFEQAQNRIFGLQTQVQTLRRTVSSIDGEGDGEVQECACKSFFENP